MLNWNKCARINVKLLIILVLVTVAIGASLFAARQVRRSILSKISLEAGQAAFENEDWPAAYKNLRQYLARNPDDIEILKKYAEAAMAIKPLDATVIGRAIGAYRRIMQLDPLDEIAYEKLAMLYTGIGNFEELAYIARKRIEDTPNDLKAQMWQAEALIALNRMEEAQEALTTFISKIETLSGKYDEYVRACLMMSKAILAYDSSTEAKNNALEYINKALDHAPESVEALASRAMFYRVTTNSSDPAYKDMLATARNDLEKADELGTENPRIRLYLAQEWMAHRELDRAAAELRFAEALPQEVLEEHFFDLNNWTVSRFLLASELMLRSADKTEGVSLAKETMTVLKEKRHLIRVLPNAIRLYVAAGNASDARQCLDEYIDIMYSQQRQTESRLGLAYLRALVAKAENDSYAVIDAIQPAIITDTSHPELWGLLAEAFIRTDQTRRAINALIQYLRIRPRDAEVRQQLTKEYLKLRDWSNALRTAQLAESQDPTKIILTLLRIEASINIVAEQQEEVVTVRRQVFENELNELTQLRKEHPERVEIYILQSMIAYYLDDPNTAEKELKVAIDECEESLRAEMQLSRFYYRSKRIAEAINNCQSACVNHPEVAEPWLFLSDLHVANKNYDSARSCLEQAQDAVVGRWEKRSVSMKLALLELTHVDGDRAMGRSILSQIAAQDKREVRARTLLLGISEVRQDREKVKQLIDELREAEGESGLRWRLYQSAMWLVSDQWRSKQQDISAHLQYCIDSDPAWSYPPLLLADMYGKLQDTGRVENIYRQALARNPSATDIVDRLVTLLEQQGRFSDAETVLQQSETNSRFTSARHAILSIRAGEFSRAIEELELRVSNDDRDANSRILLARLIYWQDKDVDQALAYLDEAEAITSGSIAITAARVSILRAEGNAEDAQRILNDYVAKQNVFGAYMMRGAYFANEGEFKRAEQDYRKLTTFTEQGPIGYELLSNFYGRNERLDKAVETLEEGLNAYPEDLRLKRRLMKTLFLQGPTQDRQKALGILAELEEQLPQDPELMKFRAVQILEESTPQSLKAAREKLENVVKLEPTAVGAHLMLIGIAMQEQDYESARDYAIRAIGSNPNSLPLLSARSRAELALENTQMAGQLAHLVLQKDPNNIESRDVLVAAALSSKDRNLLEEARTLLESAIGRDSKDEKLLISRARVLAAMEIPQNAIPELEAYCQSKEGSSSINAIVTLADLYRLSGDMEQADQRIKQAEQINPNNLTVIHARFVWLLTQNRLEELEGISAVYISAKEQNPTTFIRAASALVSLDSMTLKKEGLKLYEHVVTLSPTSKDARLGLAFSLYQTGNAERAENIYQELLKLYPNDVQILNDLAWILQEHYHRYPAALELANRALRIKPDDLYVLDTRGTILSNMPDRLAEARKDFERIVELSSPDTRQMAKALLQLGRVCVRLNDVDQAKQHLKEALEIDQKINVFTPEERTEISRLQRIEAQTVNN